MKSIGGGWCRFKISVILSEVEGPSRKRRPMEKTGYVYILCNHTRTLYAGVTSDLKGRMYAHKNGVFPGFTKDYRIDQLVYFEVFPDMVSAIAREKQIKGWIRATKVALICGRI
jgi:putative endonuclease